MWETVRYKTGGFTNLSRWGSAILTILLLSAMLISAVQAAPVLQDDRPPAEGGGDGGGGNGGGDGNGGDAGNGGGNGGAGGAGGALGDRCGVLSGEVINWGVGGMSGVAVELSTGSWQQFATSASEGNYSLGGLGVGVAVLRVITPPELGGQLQPLIQDAGVYLNCDYPVVANIALVNGPRIDPPAFIEISGPAQIVPGDNIPLRVTIKNGLPTEISNVIVTDLMPEGLEAVEVTAGSTGPENLQIIDAGVDGQLVVAFLDRLSSGQETNLFITVTVDEAVQPGAQIRNAVTLFYRESAADQDWLDFVVAPEGVSLPSLEAAQATPAAAPGVEAAEESDAMPAALAEATPAAGQEDGTGFVPPGQMPRSGGDLLPTEASPAGESGELINFVLPEKSAEPVNEVSAPHPLPVIDKRDGLALAGLPKLSLVPIALLIGLGLGGLLSVVRYLRSPNQDEA